MARSQIVVTDISRAGVAPITQTTADATNDHYFTGNDGKVFLEIVSTDGGTQTVTVKSAVTTYDGLAVADLVISIPTNATRVAGPFRQKTFNQDANGVVHLDPSVSTNLKLRAYRLTATP